MPMPFFSDLYSVNTDSELTGNVLTYEFTHKTKCNIHLYIEITHDYSCTEFKQSMMYM